MGAYYELVLSDAFGNPQGRINQFASMRYVLRENAVGALTLSTPDSALFPAISADWRIEIWRSIDGGPSYLEGSGTEGTIWLVNNKTLATDAQGLTLMSLSCVDAKDLLARRFVDYSAGSAQSSKTAALDNMAKEIVRENLGSSSYGGTFATGRDLSSVLSVQADTSALPSKSKSFAWRNVLLVLQELVTALNDTAAGNFFAFDIVKSGSGLEFRTYPDVRGVRRNYYVSGGVVNPNLLIVSADNGTLTEPAIVYDWSTEANYVKAAGEGEGAARLTGQSMDPQRIGVSPFGRRERFLDARNGGATTAALITEAVTEITRARPRLRLAGRIAESLSVRYGRDYRHGDIVTAEAFGVRFDARVTTVSVSLDANGETVEATLAGEQVIDYTVTTS